MKGSAYRERDHAFGQRMLALRTTIGLTQIGLAERLAVSRKAVGTWEAGLTYPSAEHLKMLIVLAVEQQAFPAEHAHEQINAFWQAANQKALLDQAWLTRLLADPNTQPVAASTIAAPTSDRPYLDWGDALTVTTFYGREQELSRLTEWIAQDRCRVVSVLGLGGIGKSALATRAMHALEQHFDVIIWRSLRDAPSCEELLDAYLQVLAPQALRDISASLEKRLSVLLEYLRRTRVLLVLDNLETLLEEGQSSGRMRPGYESYTRLLRQIAETNHQSCLLLTSREKPIDLLPIEGRQAAVRALRLAALDAGACQQLLAEKDVSGDPAEHMRLIEMYAGNPLALKIVAQTIVELFGGAIAPFLKQGQLVFGSLRDLLDEQFARLSTAEQSVLLWLAILRQPVSLEKLLAVLGTPLPPATVLSALESLRRRSLIELGQHPGSFTLQSVVLEYATARLIGEMSGEIQHSQLARLVEHALTLAGSSEYVRQTQLRLIVIPLLLQLRSAYPERVALEQHLLALLQRLRARADYAQGYGPANLLALLHEQRGHLRDLDLSQLALRGVYLQGAEMQDTTLAGAQLQDCVWTSTFGSIWAVAISRDGQYWAAGSRRGEVWLWAQQTLHLVWQAHSDVVRTLSFSPDGRSLSSGSYDGMIKLWDVASGALLWSGAHSNNISCIAYSPAGNLLASGGTDATVRLWDAQTGALLETLAHPQTVFTIAWSPDGQQLASLGFDGQIRLWRIQPARPASCVAILTGHGNWGMGLAFSPDGSLLASAGWDQTIKFWDIAHGGTLQRQVEQSDRVQTVAWSPDGRTLASAAFDPTIWLWDVERNTYRAALHGHSDIVFALVFTPDSRKLLSGSVDGTLRLWDVESGQSEQILQGYAVSVYDIAWSPDGSQLASGNSAGLVTIWHAQGHTPPKLLDGHRYLVFGVAWSPDGRWLASSGWDNVIQLWDATSGVAVQAMRDPNDAYTSLYGLAWSPDGQRLACGNNRQEVQLWNVFTGIREWVARELPASVRRLAWNPDGTLLACAGDDGNVYVQNAADGTLFKQLSAHQGRVNDVAWSHDGKWLASGGGNQRQADGGELFVWDVHSGERVRVLPGQPGIVYALAWSADDALLVSGGSDGMLRWWDVHSEQCLQMRPAHQGTLQSLQLSPAGDRLASCGDDGAITIWDMRSAAQLQTLRRDRPYERLDITGVRGVTEAQKATLHALGAIDSAL